MSQPKLRSTTHRRGNSTKPFFASSSLTTWRSIPWARAAFNIAAYTLIPFGSRAVNRYEITGQEDAGTGPLGVICNLIWLILAGWWLALGHVITAVLMAITIIGIPFAWAHLKLAGIALWPIGKMIVPA